MSSDLAHRFVPDPFSFTKRARNGTLSRTFNVTDTYVDTLSKDA